MSYAIYHFEVYREARIVGNWTAGGLVQAGILNASQLQAKNFSAVYSRPFSNSGSFNAVLRPGEYWIEFNLHSNSNSTIAVTTPIELVEV